MLVQVWPLLLISSKFNLFKNSKLKIRYIKFPNNLRNAYQPYTKANLKNLRNIGYKKDFISIKEGINRYLNEI